MDGPAKTMWVYVDRRVCAQLQTRGQSKSADVTGAIKLTRSAISN